MPYGDEDIIRAMLNAESDVRHTIENELSIEGKSYQFENREFPPYFSMVLPTGFEELKPEYAKQKYPHEDRPGIILSNDDMTVNFAFDCTYEDSGEIEPRLKSYRAFIKKLHPSYVFFSHGVYDLESKLKTAYYDYQGIAFDGDIYYLAFFTDLPNGGLFGSFNCPAELQGKWEPLARQMLRTIKPMPQEEGE